MVRAVASGGKVTRDLERYLASLILFLTVVVSVSAGVFMAYWTMNGLLLALGHRRQEPCTNPRATPRQRRLENRLELSKPPPLGSTVRVQFVF